MWLPGPRDHAVIAIPLGPDQTWGARAEHRVGGTIDGRWVRGTVAPGGSGWAFTVTPIWMHGAGVAVGEDMAVELAPKACLRWIDATTRRPDLRAARIADVADLLVAGVKQRPRS